MLAVAFQQDVAAIGGNAVRRHAVLDHRIEAATFHRLQYQPGEVAPAQIRQLRFIALACLGSGRGLGAMLAQPERCRSTGDGEDQQGEKQGSHARSMSGPDPGRRLYPQCMQERPRLPHDGVREMPASPYSQGEGS